MQKNEFKLFLKRTVLFGLPLFLLFGTPLVILALSGELMSIRSVIIKQRDAQHEVYYGTAYSNYSPFYKLSSVLSRKPRIISLGTSRVMQIRSQFLRDPQSFYNAGGGIARVPHLRKFLNRIPAGQQPQVILLGMDQNDVNPNFEIMGVDDYEERLNEPSNFELTVFQLALRKIFRDYADGKFNIKMLLSKSSAKIGMEACMKGAGFRRDGSRYSGDFDPNDPKNPDSHFRDSFRMIQENTGLFSHGTEVSTAAVTELDLFLAECSEKNILVVGFLPPYAETVYRKMMTVGEYTYLDGISAHLEPVFQRHGFQLFNFSDVRTVGSSDAEFLDGTHGSEKVYLRLLIHMAENSEKFASFVDVPRLKKMLAGASDSLIVIPEDPSEKVGQVKS